MTQKEEAKPATSNARGGRYQVEVRLRSDFSDAEGLEARARLNAAGVNSAREVRVSRLYEIRGPLNQGHVQQAARELLADPVTQDFRIVTNAAPSPNGMNHWRAEVWLKDSVTDAPGESVRSAMIELGLPAPDAVRCGWAYHIEGKCGRNQLEKAVARTLANPVVHRFAVTEEHK